MQDDIAMVTEVLACELARALGAAPGSPPAGPEESWSALQWQYAEVVATIHGIAPLLWRYRVRTHAGAPARWAGFLQQQAERNGQRVERMLALRNALAEGMRARGLRLLVLKGCDIAGWLYGDPALRPMGDIDVMVEPASLESFDSVAKGAGFVQAFTTSRHRCYALDGVVDARACGEAVDNPIRLDLHTNVPGIPSRFSDGFTELAWSKAIERTGPSGRWLGLDNSSLAVHLLVHTAESVPIRWARFLQFIDLYLLAGNGLDWGEVEWQVRKNSLGWRTYPAIALLQRYFPETVPASLVDAARRDASFTTRRVMRSNLARFSLCNLVDFDPFATLSGKAGLVGGALYVIDAMLFDRGEYKGAHAGLSEREVIEIHENRMKRWAAWLVGRTGYRPNILRMFTGAPESTATENPQRSA